MKYFLSVATFVILVCAFESASAQTRRIYTVKPTVLTVETKRNSNKNYGGDERLIHSLINSERRKKNLNQLYWDDALARLARDYAGKMARQNFFGHYDNGGTIASRARSSNIYGWRKLGENLFYCEQITDFDDLAVQRWMKSAGHRQNILDKSWTATGIGVAASGSKIYIAQVFIQR